MDLKLDFGTLYNQYFKYSTESPPFPTGTGRGESVRIACANTMEYILTSLYTLFNDSFLTPVNVQGGGVRDGAGDGDGAQTDTGKQKLFKYLFGDGNVEAKKGRADEELDKLKVKGEEN